MATELAINPDPVRAFFNDLEAKNNLLSKINDLHKTLTGHFSSIEKTLAQKSETLDSQVKTFKENTQITLEKLRNREDAITGRESLMAEHVDEKRAASLAEIAGSDSLGNLKEKSLPEVLRIYCRMMDSDGVITSLLRKRKESSSMKSDIANAMAEAVDPMRLVLDAVEDFVDAKVEGKVGMADKRWACGMLILSVLSMEGGSDGVGRSLKERAVQVLSKWESILGGGEGGGGVGSSEATMFLQMVIGFGLKEDFDEDFLRNLVLEFASRRDMPKLAVSLGFGDKLVDIIEELVKRGKEIEAVYFSSECGLTERFSPGSLLKSCLRNCKRSVNSISKKGSFNPATVEKAANLELECLKAIIKCVAEHKIESQFPIDNLKTRITQLEKAKAEKNKSTASTSKPSNKRARTDNSIRGRGSSGRGSRGRGSGGRGSGGRGSRPPSNRPPKAGRFSNASPSFRPRNPQLHLQPPARYAGDPYNIPSQGVYEIPGAAAYGGAHTQSPVGAPQQYGGYAHHVGVGGQSNYAASDYAAVATAYDYGGATAPAAASTYPSSYVPAYTPSYPS